jgi:hypothetical protein
MKAFYESQLQAPAPARQVSVNAISFDDNFDPAMEVRNLSAKNEGWVSVDVEEKRKRDGMDFIKNARPRTHPPAPIPPPVSGPAPGAHPVPPGATSQTQPSGSPNPSPSATMDIDSETSKPKYKLQSELGKTNSPTDVGEKII